MRTLALLAALALAGCGVDGPPEPKDGGIGVSGEVEIGIVGEL